jgi:transposase
MMAREGLHVDSQTLWDQLNAIARHLEPTYEALGRRALDASVINVDETRWAIMGSPKPAAGTVWGVHAPGVSFDRILPGKSAEEGREVLAAYQGIAVVDGFAVYEVLARYGPGFTLAHCWTHTKRKYDEIATNWPTVCAEISELIGELYAIERLVPGPFPGECRRPGAAAPTPDGAVAADPRSHLEVGHRTGRSSAQRFRQGRPLHAGALDRPHPLC